MRIPTARPSFEARKGAHLRMTVCGRRKSPLAARRTAPVLQRRPDAAREAEAIDWRRGAQRLEAMQLDAAPLEAALLQNVARGRIGDPRAGNQVLHIQFPEREIDHPPPPSRPKPP